MKPLHTQESSSEPLTASESEFIHFFVRLASALSLPRSVGELFGLLFAAQDPLPFDEIVERLGISKGSVSQGLKFLTKAGAISVVYVPRDRRTFYAAETSMRRLFGSALKETVRPHLEGNHPYFDRIEESIEKSARETDESPEHLEQRLAALQSWNEKALQMLPLLEFFFSAPIPKSLFDLMKRHPEQSEPNT